MIALAIVVSILILLALLRFGVSVEYSADGLVVKILAGPLRLKAFPKKEKIVSASKEAKRKARKEEKDRKKAEKKEKAKTEEKKPGAMGTVLELLPAIKKTLGRLRRRLLIKRLVIHYTVAGDDPYKTAMTFGNVNAAIGVVLPVLEKAFRIRRRDFRAVADFSSSQQGIYINAAISLAVWEAVYIVFAILPAGIRVLTNKGTTERKEELKDGKDTDS